MVCHHPYIKHHEGQILQLQCGKCPRCKIRRVNQWVFRIKKEQERSISSHFITLTYAPQSLPKTKRGLGTLKKRDIQNFIRRLREFEKAAGNPKIIKYFAAGEYGDEFKRPHYHIVLLNISDLENVKKAWTKKGKSMGIIDVGQLNQKTIAYTIKYIDKKCYIGYSKTDQRERQFQLQSKGLGSNYLTDQQKEYHRNNPLKNYVQLIDGYKVGMPRYYAKHIWNTDQLKEKRLKILVEHLEEREQKIRRKYESLNRKIDYDTYLNLRISKERCKFDTNLIQNKRLLK
jgi:hypothetical protein